MFEATYPAQNDDTSRSTVDWCVFVCGLLLYVVSFYLPAISVAKLPTWSAPDDTPYLGWQCAMLTSGYPFPFFVIFGGTVNVLAFTFIVLFILNDARRLRAFCAAALAVNLLLPVIFVFVPDLVGKVHIGFFAWVVGLLLMIGRDVWKVMLRLINRG